jgi:MFS family permease
VPTVRDELVGPGRRAVTVGIVLLISLVAFEQMGVGTAMPAVVAELGTVADYAWPFVAFVATTVVGTVLGGRWCDARGPRLVLLLAPGVFGLGLLVAGTAGTLGQLLAGRLLQGLGAGAQGVAVYVLIALVYSAHARPAVFGLVSSAWVVPSLVGPPVAGLVTEHLSWHWVFLGLLPLVALAVLLVLPAVRGMAAPVEPAPPRRGLVPAAVAAALGVSALSWAGQHPTPVGAVLAVAALTVLVPALRRLVPKGTVRARRGIAAVVAGRALIAGAFFTVTAYLPLMLTATHGWSLSAAGLPLIVGSLGWSGAAAWQGRRPELSRPRLLRIGMLLIATGTAGLLVVAPAWGVAWAALPLWLVAGVGMGLGFSSLSALLLAGSAPDAGSGVGSARSASVGYHSSAAQLADQLAQATFVGLGGALLAVLVTPAVALPVLLVVLVVLALAGAAVAPRTAPRPTDP